MAGSKSNYLSKALLNLPLGATAFTAPVTLYIGLWTTALDDTSTSATAGETTYPSYARVAVTNNATNFPAAIGSSLANKSNGTAWTFPQSTGSTTTIVALGVFDVASGAGNCLYWTTVNTQVVNFGDQPQVNTGFASWQED